MNEPTAQHATAYRNWRLETDAGGVCWLCIDNAEGSANVLSGEVLQELDSILEELERQVPKGLVLYSGKKNGFVMGADIKEFTNIGSSEEAFELVRLGQGVVDRVEALPCPSLAVINGFALGGGLELAMACRYRIGIEHPKPVIGLPEVQLGLHPGFGGTVRTVALSGVRNAMQLMLTGKSITIGKAHRIGLVDEVTDSEQWRDAAQVLLSSGRPRASAPIADRLLNLPFIRPFLARILRSQVASKALEEHYPAPYAIIDLWRSYGASGERAYVAEAKSFAALMAGSTSRNLVRVFFLQNKLKSQGSKDARRIETVHVVGAGVMGGDIAAWCALRGLAVTLQDREDKYVQPAMARASQLFDRKSRSPADREAVGKRLKSDVAGAGASDADLVIEAIFEDVDAKQALYRDLQAKMKPGAILATNTSSIRLEDLRTLLDKPGDLIGLHFFNPVAQMPLVEVIRCEDTDPAVIDAAFGFVKRIGKLGLECASAPGFVVNRVLGPYMAEAAHLAEEGVALADIDAAATHFGMPMGPIELVDTVGIDIALNVSRVLGKAFNRAPPEQLQAMVDAGHLGRKSGQGFYRWENDRPVRENKGGNVPGDIEDRLILPLVNEAVACLAEGVVEDADLLDAGVIFGTGFAPFRGGPLQYARERGVDAVRKALEGLAGSCGDRYRPHPGWNDFK